jgi:hypothetical protein
MSDELTSEALDEIEARAHPASSLSTPASTVRALCRILRDTRAERDQWRARAEKAEAGGWIRTAERN